MRNTVAGRKPKPTQLKKLEGNPGKRPLNDNEPQPDSSIPNCPWWLDYHARTEWKRVCPELHRLGLLTSVDRTALAGYCVAYSMVVRATKEINSGFLYDYQDKKTLEDGKTPELKRSKKPEVGILMDALSQVRLFCSEFGLTPSARSRLSMPSKQPAKDPMEELLDYCRESTKNL